MSKKLVIFDLDGTLMDTSSGILLAVRDAIKEHGMPELSEEQIRTFIGPPIQWSFEAQYGISKEQAQSCLLKTTTNILVCDPKVVLCGYRRFQSNGKLAV